MFLGGSTISEAKAPIAVLGKDYAVTYQKAEFFKDTETSTDYNAIVEIQNISTGNLYLASAQFDFYFNGVIVASESFISADPNIIEPGEKGYFYANLGGSINVPYAQYDFTPTLTVKKTNLPTSRHIIDNITLKDGRFGGVDVVGTITDTSGKDQSMTWISIVFYDSNGFPICCAGTNVMNLPAGATLGFETEPYCRKDILLTDIAAYKITASTMQYVY